MDDGDRIQKCVSCTRIGFLSVVHHLGALCVWCGQCGVCVVWAVWAVCVCGVSLQI